ncbi:hypothetical protein FBU31_007660, partial [Coemansia sp. 'formosensis']
RMFGRLLFGVVASVAGSLGHSLGMTLQKRAHLRLESQGGSDKRHRAWKDKEWQFGLALYLFSSTVPPTIALSILPVFVAAPLAAVGLVANAVFAKCILASSFARTDMLGTLLVSLGSCCVAVFGAIDEPLLSLNELLMLYRRPAYVVFFVLYSALVMVLIATELYWRRRYVRLSNCMRDSCSADSFVATPRVALHQVSALRWQSGTRGTFTEHAPLLSPSSSDSSSGYSSVTEQLSPEPEQGDPSRICNDSNVTGMLPASTEAVDCMYRRHFSEANEALLSREVKTSRGEQVARYVSGLLSAVLSGLLCSQTLLLAKSGIGLLLLT